MIIHSIVLFLFSLLLLCMGLLYPDPLIFLVGFSLFFLSIFPGNKASRFFGWIAAAVLGITLLFIPPPKAAEESPSPAPIEKITLDIEQQEPVYITPHGQRYHLKSTCGGKNSTRTTLTSAMDQGYTPCKKCVD